MVRIQGKKLKTAGSGCSNPPAAARAPVLQERSPTDGASCEVSRVATKNDPGPKMPDPCCICCTGDRAAAVCRRAATDRG